MGELKLQAMMNPQPLPFPLLQVLVGDEEVTKFFSNDAEIRAMVRSGAVAELTAAILPEICGNALP